jgi:hypothetical protein
MNHSSETLVFSFARSQEDGVEANSPHHVSVSVHITGTLPHDLDVSDIVSHFWVQVIETDNRGFCLAIHVLCIFPSISHNYNYSRHEGHTSSEHLISSDSLCLNINGFASIEQTRVTQHSFSALEARFQFRGSWSLDGTGKRHTRLACC